MGSPNIGNDLPHWSDRATLSDQQLRWLLTEIIGKLDAIEDKLTSISESGAIGVLQGRIEAIEVKLAQVEGSQWQK